MSNKAIEVLKEEIERAERMKIYFNQEIDLKSSSVLTEYLVLELKAKWNDCEKSIKDCSEAISCLEENLILA